MNKRKIRQRIKYLYKYRSDDIQIIQICVYDLDRERIYVRTMNERIKPYTISKVNKKQSIPDKNRCKSVCTILKDHAENMKDDPERLSTSFLQKIIGIECK